MNKSSIIIIISFLFIFTNIKAQIPPCNLYGGSVYIDNPSWMMNASVNGMSIYSYSWTDTNGTVIASANQTPFYTQWCVTITDDITGCDTTICQDCIADSTALCTCILIYMPVCGCDGVMYSNSCIADCADVPWTPATSNGMPGGFLPCIPTNTFEYFQEKVSIYPNPSSNIINLMINDNSELNVSIIDVNGKVIMKANNIVGSNVFDIESFDSGIYFLKFENININFYKKIIIE